MKLAEKHDKKQSIKEIIQRANDIRENSTLFERIERHMKEENLFLNKKLNRQLLASRLATNEVYIANAIRHNTNMSVVDYVNSYRLDYAKELICSGKIIHIKDLPLTIGFSSSRTFHRQFKLKFGITPGSLNNPERLNN